MSCLIVRVCTRTKSYFLGSNPIKKLTKSLNLYGLYIYNNNRYKDAYYCKRIASANFTTLQLSIFKNTKASYSYTCGIFVCGSRLIEKFAEDKKTAVSAKGLPRLNHVQLSLTKLRL